MSLKPINFFISVVNIESIIMVYVKPFWKKKQQYGSEPFKYKSIKIYRSQNDREK